MAQRLIKAVESIIAALVRLFRWWVAWIRRENTIQGKAIVGCLGVLVICFACSIPVALVNGPRKTAPAAAIAPSARPTIVEAAAPTQAPTETQKPTKAPEPTRAPPTATTAPTVAPSATPEPTQAPTAPPLPTPKPKPTAKPQPTAAPTTEPTAEPAQIVAPQNPQAEIPTAVDVGAAPCQPGQIKGNRRSHIYHMPGQRDYARTYANVQCFDTEAEAIAAGFRKAQR